MNRLRSLIPNNEVSEVSSKDARSTRIIAFVLFFVTAVPAFAALSPKYEEWGNGPVQWIMNKDDKRAWRNVTTDTDAVNFIDLFWVRRDPTPGTAINEYRNEFDSRVAFSDKKFVEKRKRGAMTDRGRVYIVLGAATSMGAVMRQTNAQGGVARSSGDSDPTGGRQMGARDIWVWEHADARKFEMGRIEVVFVENPTTRAQNRDPLRTDFGLAETVAIRKAVVNPELTSVPDWAAFGGLEPMARIEIAELPPAPVRAQATPAPAATIPFPPGEPVDSAPAVASNAPGASRLTLLPGGSINVRSATDPFTAKSLTTISAGKDVPWAVQYCSAKPEVPKLKFTLVITGPLDGASSEQMTRQKDAKPERLAAQPGCYALQGMMPSKQLAPGRYKLRVMIDDAVSGDIHDVTQQFQVQ